MRTVEVLTAEPVTPRAQFSLSALSGAVPDGVSVRQTKVYEGGSDWLMLWGPGEPTRALAISRQVAAGGHAIALDLAYWSRDFKQRISFDAPHPQAWVMRRALPDSRLASDRPPVADYFKPKGHIIIAGVGCKARRQYGAAVVEAWENEMARECRERWPTRPVIRRPKKPVVIGIDQALHGASLVITWHSNVAVDAIRLGIPVVCRDGAAAAVCPSALSDGPTPLASDVRDRFLANLAWFQWDLRYEAHQCWAFLEEMLA